MMLQMLLNCAVISVGGKTGPLPQEHCMSCHHLALQTSDDVSLGPQPGVLGLLQKRRICHTITLMTVLVHAGVPL